LGALLYWCLGELIDHGYARQSGANTMACVRFLIEKFRRPEEKKTNMTNDEYEKLIKEIRYNRQMQKKRLYEQAKRALKKEKNA